MKSTKDPKRVRPVFPKEWGVPHDPKVWVTWSHASKKLREEKVYWVSTVRVDGRPHSVPVWGVWLEDKFYFESGKGTVKARNLAANPRLVVHLQDGLDTVIVEGSARLVRSKPFLSTLSKMYSEKYDYAPDWSGPDSENVYGVSPKVAHAWKAPRMHRSIVRFEFGSGGK